MISKKENEILKNWKGNLKKPVVSICCTTYNHEKYISQAIDSFLAQVTEFPFEVIIRDDASTDKTAEIIRNYEENFPNILKPIYETENGFKKGIKPLPLVISQVKGKYVAICEGDDFWVDENKLQKQVDFLENNPDFSICFHSVIELYESSGEKKISNLNQKENTTIKDLAECNYIHTCSCVFRKSYEELPYWFLNSQMPFTDYAIHLINAQYGKIKFLNETMAVYRIHDGGVWSVKSESYKKRKLIIFLNLLKDKFDSEINEILLKQMYMSCSDLIRKKFR